MKTLIKNNIANIIPDEVRIKLNILRKELPKQIDLNYSVYDYYNDNKQFESTNNKSLITN